MKRRQTNPRRRVRLRGPDFATLRAMARTAVWAEIGGKAAGWTGQYNPLGAKSQRQMNEEGEGRTHWVGMPDFARGLGMSRAQIKATVEKAIAGKPLGEKQRRLITAMLAEFDSATKPQDCPF